MAALTLPLIRNRSASPHYCFPSKQRYTGLRYAFQKGSLVFHVKINPNTFLWRKLRQSISTEAAGEYISYSIRFDPLSLVDVFRLTEVKAYEYVGDIILTVDEGDQNHLLHLYENEIDGETLYALNLGQAATLPGQPFFVGKPSAIEVALVKNETAWDFQSLLLKDDSGSIKVYCLAVRRRI